MSSFIPYKQRFSIRKYAVGSVSVLIGMSFFLGSQSVLAEENKAEVISGEIGQTTIVEAIDTAVLAPSSEMVEVDETVSNVSQSSEELVELKPTSEEMEPASPPLIASESAIIEITENKEAVQELPISTVVPQSDIPQVMAAPEAVIEEDEAPLVRAESVNLAYSISGDDYPWKHQIGYIDGNGYPAGQCTAFVAWKITSNTNFTNVRQLGNGGQWGDELIRRGATFSEVPVPGSVAFWRPGWDGADATYGHVAWVSAVEGDQIRIEEYNYNWSLAYYTRLVSASSPSGYIHFGNFGGPSPEPARTETVRSTQTDVLAASGTHIFSQRSAIRNEPKLSSPTVAYYNAGQSVNYDKTLDADGYKWLSYLSYDGIRRYIAIDTVKTSSTNLIAKENKADIFVQNHDNSKGTYDVIITNIQSMNGIKNIKVPTWSDVNGQDDIIWYNATRQADGSYKLTVNIANHNNQEGLYHSHVYLEQSQGQLVGLGALDNITVTKSQRLLIPSSGRYIFKQRASVRATASSSSPELAYYSAGSSVNYDRVVMAEDKQWISYIAASGNRRYISIT